MSNRILQEMSELSEEKQILELQLQRRNLQAANQALNKINKRQSSRLANQRVKKRRIQATPEARDSIKVAGFDGTLGSQIFRLGSAIDIKGSKSRYFAW
ncbi:hypothetical protein DFQ28_009057 [Apophysomyces sp. BC1034]|nr:hypothetical protein DFQ30_007646 [Apophysomyces sp. BC1015]KAG0176767.1 hypothetical protein DFQ29_005673 [Apophysomyces sp. BC1021]KAG0185625.1 hypothetical protein DFQ28_009057 [Apophysomyces sp. BC1034]